MNRLLSSLYDQFCIRLIRPILVCLMQWFIRPVNASERDWCVPFSVVSKTTRRGFFSRKAVPIGMLLAGWLGATGVQAQTCGTYRLTTTQFASAANVAARTGTGGICTFLTCSVNNEDRVADSDLTNAATINLTGIATQGFLSTKITSSTLPAGAKAGYVIDDGILSLGVLPTITITTYLNGSKQNEEVLGSLLNLPIIGTGKSFVSIATSKPFDEIQIKFASLAGALQSYAIYYPLAVYDGSISGTNPTTFGGTNGTASIALTTPASITQVALTYSWNNGGSTSALTGLSAGTYSGTISSGVGCLYTNSVTLSNPALVATGGGLAFMHGADDNSGAGSGVSIWVSNGDGTFKTNNVFDAGFSRDNTGTEVFGDDGSSATFYVDATGDGIVDIVHVTENNSNSIDVYTGNGKGGFAKTPITTTGMQAGTDGYVFAGIGGAEQSFMADVDGDGDMDYAFSGNDDKIHVYLGNGNGTFATTRVTTSLAGASGYHTSGVTGDEVGFLNDVNGDGKADLVMTHQFPSTTEVWLATSGGSFNPTVIKTTGFSQTGSSIFTGKGGNETSAIIDVTGDGKPDFVHANEFDGKNTIFVFAGNGSGGFATSFVSSLITNPPATFNYVIGEYGSEFGQWVDVTGDGKPDFVCSHDGLGANSGIYVYTNNGTGTFTATPIVSLAGCGNFQTGDDYTETTGIVKVFATGTAFSSNGRPIPATGNIAPGGVTSDLSLWLRAEDLASIANGAKVDSWSDAVTSGQTLWQPASGSQPTLYKSTGSKLINFNPALSFNGAQELKTEHRIYCGTSPFYLSTVAFDERTNRGELRAPMGVGPDGNYPAFDLQTDGVSPNGWNPWMSGSSPAEWSGGSALLFNGNTGGMNRQPQVFALHSGNTSGGSNNIISSVNSFTEATTLDANQQSEIGNGLFIGSSGGEQWLGRIPEAVVYSRQLTSSEQQRVNSYLATKYGITQDQRTATDYVASDGTTKFWNAVTNGIYKANIGAIGRDDASGLEQKQSQSVNAQVQPIISIATIAVSNSASTGSFTADKSFAAWADNGNPHSYSITYVPTSFTPAGGVGFYRMAATWRMQQTGSIGTSFFVGIPTSSFADRLLISSSASFPSGSTQEISLVSDGQGNLVTQTAVTITDGQFFTFGAAEKAPGGVVNGLSAWFKANDLIGSDGDKIDTWTSSVLSKPYAVTQNTASRQPTLGASTTALTNFNQTVNFDRSASQALWNLSANPIASTPASTTPSYHFLVVAEDQNVQNDAAPYYNLGDIRGMMGNGSSGNNPAMDLEKDGASPNGWNPWTDASGSWDGGNATLYNGGGRGYTDGGNSTESQQISGNLIRLLNQQPQIFGLGYTFGATSKLNSVVDGYVQQTTLNGDNASSVNNSSYYIGSSGGEHWEGNVDEVIAYDRELSASELTKVNTYLAIKWGVTLGQGNSSPATVGANINSFSYVATDGTVIWNSVTNSGYSYDIAGIGQDNFEGLNQRQSRSVNGTFQPAIGLGTVATTNDANPNVFTVDKSYMIWGSNGLSDSYSVSYAPHSFTAAAPVYLMNRIWKVQETGTVGTVMVSVPGSMTGTYLLVSNTASFTTGTPAEYAMTADGNGNLVATVDLTNGQYFTFANTRFAPGCVGANLVAWYKADLGAGTTDASSLSLWKNQVSGTGYDLTQPTAANQPTYYSADPNQLLNFNPVVTFDGTNDHIRNTAQLMPSDSPYTFVAVGVDEATDLGYRSLFSSEGLVDYFSLYQQGGAPGDNGWVPYSVGGASDRGSFGKGTKYSASGGANGFWNGTNYTSNATTQVIVPQVVGMMSQNSASTDPFYSWLDGYKDHPNWSPLDEGAAAMNTYRNQFFQALAVGADMGANGAAFEFWKGRIPEFIVFDRQLTDTEMQKVNSYLAIKYGVTLGQGNGVVGKNGNGYNYLRGDGTVIWDASVVPAYQYNIFGIGRDDCQQLEQKQSKSVNSGAKMTISVSGTIAATNATNPGSFTTDASFIVIGDNGQTGTSSLTQAGSCPVPPLVDKYTNLAYKITETGSVTAVYIKEDVSTFGFNAAYPLYMQVFSDAGFTNLLASVPMSYSSGFATTLYDFPTNSTSYIRFAGNTAAPANMCAAPTKQTFHWNGWDYGSKQKVLLPNYIPSSQSATAAMTMSVTVTDGGNNNLLYKPNVDWWPVFDGYGLFIPRNDNNTTSGTLAETNVITTRMQFRQGTSTSVVSAQTVDFLVYDIDGYIGGRDIVKIYGKQGSNIIAPQLSQYKPTPFDALQLNYQGDPQQAIGSNIPWDLGAWGNIYVSFSQPVEEVYVEYQKDNTYGFNVYNDMRIGPVTVACAPPTPKEPLVDNVYIYKEVSPNPGKTGEQTTYKFTIQNTNCASKTVSLNDVLPGGLNWTDSTFVYSTSLTVGSVNNYGNTNTLTATNITVPPGTHYMYASVTGLNPGVYNNQASYVVTNGTGATYLSDDPSVTGTTAQPTPLTLIANDPEANLVVSKSVDMSTAPQNGTLTYTYSITNPNASAILTTFQDLLPGELTYIGGTLTGVGSATASPYSGSAVLSIRGLSVAAGSSLTFSVQTNVNSYTVGAVANNVALVSPDVNSGYRIKTYTSNVASTTIIQPPTVAILSPASSTTTALNTTVSGTATPGATVVLTSSTSGMLCSTTATAGGTWSCPVNLVAGPQTLSAVATNTFGVSTPATTQVTAVSAALQVSNPPALTATSGTTQTGNAATELTPSGGTAPYTYSNDTGNASCSAVAGATALPGSNLTVVSGTGSYSYTAPSTPGTYYFCIKVCDSSTPTPICVTKTYTLIVSPNSATGTLDCSSAMILGIASGTPGNGTLKLTMAVSTTGVFQVTVTGSGLSANPSPYVASASSTGTQVFYIPLTYSGAAFATGTTITVPGFGTCMVDMTAVTPKTVTTSVLNLGPACAPATAATLIK